MSYSYSYSDDIQHLYLQFPVANTVAIPGCSTPYPNIMHMKSENSITDLDDADAIKTMKIAS